MPRSPLVRRLLPTIAVIAGILSVATVWVLVACLSNRSCGWFALASAAVIVLMLRLSNMPAGTARALIALLGNALTIALSLWMIVATQLGFVFGLGPLTSALRLGPVLAWELTRLNLHVVDWIFIALSLPLATWWGAQRAEP